jgi:hypothetical protein
MRNAPSDFLRISSLMIAAVGSLMIIIAVMADWLGIGGWPGFGSSQGLLAFAGFLILLTGWALRTRVGQEWARKLLRSPLMLVLFGIFMALLFIEAGLRVRQVLLSEALHNPVPDPKLGVRIAPYALGHDAKGWRNDTVPDQVEIVAIGDSQTWGVNVGRSHAWPQTLARISGRTVYNMALGYYGTVEYWALIDEAMEFSPKVIIIGLYFGNDLYGAYRTVYRTDTYAQFRSREWSEELLEDTIAPRVEALSREREKSRWLPQRSALVRELQARGIWPGFKLDKVWAVAYPHDGAAYEHPEVRTVFTAAYRLLALDLDDPRISEGLRITEEMLLNIQARADRENVRLLVLLIPTKELVYADAMQAVQGARLDETYSSLVAMEEKARSEIIRYCQEHRIEQVDALPVLREAVVRGEQIYPESTDGHPIERGYFLLASAVQNALDKAE